MKKILPDENQLIEKKITNTKLLTWAAFIGGSVAYIYVLQGWRSGCSDGAMMSTGPLVIIAVALLTNGFKSGYENGKKIEGPMNKRFMKALFNAGASAMAAGNPASAAATFLQTMESEKQEEKMEEQDEQPIDQTQYADSSAAPLPENMPADDAVNYTQSSGESTPQ